MTMFDEAKSLRGLINMRGLKQAELAKILGVSQPYIANKLRLLGFSADMQRGILSGGISERHARVLLRLPEELQPVGLQKIVEGKMTAAEAEIMADCLLEESRTYTAPKGINTAERIGRFEELLETSIANLRLFGISAKAKRESLILQGFSVIF